MADGVPGVIDEPEELEERNENVEFDDPNDDGGGSGDSGDDGGGGVPGVIDEPEELEQRNQDVGFDDPNDGGGGSTREQDDVGAQTDTKQQSSVLTELEQREKQLERQRDQLTQGPRGAVAAQNLSSFQQINEKLLDVRNEQTEIQSGGEPVVLEPGEQVSQDDVSRAAKRQAREISNLTGKPVGVSKKVNPQADVTSQPDTNNLTPERFQGGRSSIQPEQQETPVPREVLRDLQRQQVQSQQTSQLEQGRNREIDEFGEPVSDLAAASQFEAQDGPTTPFQVFGEAIEPAEEKLGDELQSLLSDVEEIEQGKPATTQRQRVLDRIDQATKAEGLEGEQSATDILQGFLVGSATVSQTPQAVEEFAEEGKTDALSDIDQPDPDESPVATLTALATEELAFEGLARGPSLLDEAVPSARASSQTNSGRRIRGAVDEAKTRSPFDADTRITRQDPSDTGQGKLTGDVDEGVDISRLQQDQSVGTVETTSPEETLDVRLTDRETGETLPVGPDTRLGEKIVTENPERFGVVDVSQQPGRPDSERLAEELVGSQPDEGVDVRDVLSRFDETSDEATQRTLGSSDTQTLPGDPDTTPQEVEQATVNVINEDTGMIRSVDQDQAFDLLQDDEFRFAGRELTPRERTRVQRARRTRQRRGLDLPEEVRQQGPIQRSLDDEFQQLTAGDEDTTLTAAGNQNALDEFFNLDRRGQGRLSSPETRRPTRDVQDFVDDTQPFRETDELVDEIRRGDDLFPQADTVDDLTSDDFGFIPGRPRAAPLNSLFQEQGQRQDRGIAELSEPGQSTDQGVIVDSDTRVGDDTLFRVDEETSQGLRITEGTSQTTADTTRTLEPTRSTDTEEPARNRQRPPTTPPPFDLDLGSNESQGQGSFDALVKQDGRFVDIGDFRSKQSAFEAGSRVADNTAARSVKVEGPGGRAVDVDGVGAQFRESKSSDNVFVEKDEFAIDTEGEKQDITVKGLLASQNQTTNNSQGSGGFFDDTGSQNTFDF